MRAIDADRLLAASVRVRSALRALERDDGAMGQGYHNERLVEQARLLSAVVDDLWPLSESTGSSGSVLPA